MVIQELVEKYLAWCRKHRSPRSVEWYEGHLRRFCCHLGDRITMSAMDLKPYHVVEWIDSQDGWGDTYKRGGIMAVQRAFNWAVQLGYIAVNPVKSVPKPPASRRDNPMTPADFERLLGELRPRDPFRDIFLFCWHSGCRPQEARHIEPRHVDLDHEQIVIPKEEAKGRKRARVILLYGPALDIVRRLIVRGKSGKLFLNSRGKPWSKYALCNRLHRLSKKTGLHFSLYDARHGFCQRLLERGVNHLAVAELLGHVNGQMVSAVYSHMNRATAHLRDALKKADG